MMTTQPSTTGTLLELVLQDINDISDGLRDGVTSSVVAVGSCQPLGHRLPTEWATGQDLIDGRLGLVELVRNETLESCHTVFTAMGHDDQSLVREAAFITYKLKAGAWLLGLPLTMEAVEAIATSDHLPNFIKNTAWVGGTNPRELMIRFPVMLSLVLALEPASISPVEAEFGCPATFAAAAEESHGLATVHTVSRIVSSGGHAFYRLRSIGIAGVLLDAATLSGFTMDELLTVVSTAADEDDAWEWAKGFLEIVEERSTSDVPLEWLLAVRGLS